MLLQQLSDVITDKTSFCLSCLFGVLASVLSPIPGDHTADSLGNIDRNKEKGEKRERARRVISIHFNL